MLVHIFLLAALTALPYTASAETLVERGRYLVEGPAACGNCHTPKAADGTLVADKALAGGFRFHEPAFTAWAPNITPDPDTGIGRWSDAQIIAAIREGRRPDGSLIGPPMPINLYRSIADDDVRAMVAYLRSLPPVRNPVPKSEYRIPLPASYGPPVGQVAPPPREDRVAYGAYLAGPIAHCIECHTPMLPGGRRLWERVGAGGEAFEGPWGVSVAANITPNPERGLSDWTDAEIARAIQQGVSRDGRALYPPMAYGFYARIAPDDITAIVAYLRSLRPARND